MLPPWLATTSVLLLLSASLSTLTTATANPTTTTSTTNNNNDNKNTTITPPTSSRAQRTHGTQRLLLRGSSAGVGSEGVLVGGGREEGEEGKRALQVEESAKLSLAVLGTQERLQSGTSVYLSFVADIPSNSNGVAVTGALTKRGLDTMTQGCGVQFTGSLTMQATNECLVSFLTRYKSERDYVSAFSDMPNIDAKQAGRPVNIDFTTPATVDGLYFFVIWDGREMINLHQLKACKKTDNSCFAGTYDVALEGAKPVS